MGSQIVTKASSIMNEATFIRAWLSFFGPVFSVARVAFSGSP
jgi:hypothetical protein